VAYLIKLAAFDVDGTLRDRDYLPESTKAALQKLRENGVVIALCTGRSEHEMALLREELGIDWAITCNGSHVGMNGKTMFGNAFERSVVQKWIQEAEQSNHTVLLYGSERMYINREDAPYFAQAQEEIGFIQPDLFLTSLGQAETLPDIYQFIVFCNDQEEQAYFAGDANPYYTHRWRPWAFDINPQGMNKAIGLHRLIQHLGIQPEEVAAFGDGLNDLEMIESVGMGIAMGNAIQELKDKARYVTKTLDEDGIAYAVEHYVLAGQKRGSEG
jgi:Cof subfamily protein (haloacid dehalogenase superfamily)